ncbi:MAG: cupin [Gammaproteobacteria bacterium]|jgi:mannose-6-phosphate isomerase-like protein (cupin superfamily)|nr:cupin [Gammaproteobacteria bacterium]
MSDYVKKFTAADEFYFKEGCFIIEMSNDPDDADVSVAQARLETGQQTKWHWLNDTFERYVILQGEGLVEVGAEEPTEVYAGDTVLIPPQTRQRIKNIGTADLKFLAICSPRFSHRNYRNL